MHKYWWSDSSQQNGKRNEPINSKLCATKRMGFCLLIVRNATVAGNAARKDKHSLSFPCIKSPSFITHMVSKAPNVFIVCKK